MPNRNIYGDNNTPKMSYQTRITNSQGSAVSEIVNVVIQIFSPSNNCLLYEENQTNIDLSLTNGLLNIFIGSTVGSSQRSSRDPGLTMNQIYNNNGTSILTAGTPYCSSGYTSAATDSRILKLIIRNQYSGPIITLTETINSVPYALVANTLRGKTVSDFIAIENQITQTNIDSLVDGSSDASLLHHHDSLYLSKGGGTDFNTGSLNLGIGIRYTNYDLGFGGDTQRTIGMERNSTASGNHLTLAAGDARSASTNRAGGNLILSSGISTGNNSSQIEFKTSNPTPSGATDNSLVTRMTISGNGYVGIGTTIPPAYPLQVVGDLNASQSLCLNGNCITSWAQVLGGSVENIATTTGLLGGPISTTGTISVDVGITNGQIVQVETNDQISMSVIPVIDTARIATGSISGDKIADLTLTNTDFSSTAAIDLSKISSGIVTSTSFNYLVGTTSNIQTQLDNKVQLSGDFMTGSLTLTKTADTGEILFKDFDGSTHFLTLKAPSNISTSFSLIMPEDNGTLNQILQTDGTGALTWVTNLATGTAGGSLMGNYPNPEIATNVITTNEILDGSVSTSDFGDGQISLTKLQNLTAGRILIGDSSNRADEAMMSGDATLSSTGVFNLGNATITSTKILDGTIVEADLHSSVTFTPSQLGPGILTLSQTSGPSDTGQMRLMDGAGLFYLSLMTPISVTQNYELTLPDSMPSTSGMVLMANPAGLLSWTSVISIGDSAGGDLTGTYLNPSIATSAVTSGMIVDGTLINSDFAANASIDATKIHDGNVDNTEFSYLDGLTSNIQNQLDSKLSTSGGTMTGPLVLTQTSTTGEIRFKDDDGSDHYLVLRAPASISTSFTLYLPPDEGSANQVLKTDGSGTLSWGDNLFSGPAGGDFTGTYPNPSLATGAITSNHILDGTILSVDIGDSQITFDKLVALNPGHILIGNALNIPTASTLSGDASLTSTGYLSINDDAVTSLKISDYSIMNADIHAAAAINATKFGTGLLSLQQTVGASDTGTLLLQDLTGLTGFALLSPIALNHSYNLTLPSTYPTTNGLALTSDTSGNLSWSSFVSVGGTAGGDLTGSYPNPTIVNSVVTSTHILDGTILNADIHASAAINPTKIATGIVDNTEFSYLDGTTSNIQTQIASKVRTIGDTMTGALYLTQSSDSGEMRFKDNDGVDHYMILKASTSMSSNFTLTLPVNDGDNNQILSTDGNGILSWIDNTITGPAGGDLSGTYPDPTIATGAITSTYILDGTIASIDIADSQITFSKLENLTAGYILVGSSTNAATAVTMNGDATLSSTGVLTVSTSSVTSSHILNATIVNADVSTSAAINPTKIGNGLFSLSQTTNATDTGTLRLTDSTQTNYASLNAPITLVANYTLTLPSAYPLSDGQILTSDTSGNLSWTSIIAGGTAGGDFTGTFFNPTIAANAVTSNKVLDGSIADIDISSTASIDATKLGTGIISNTEYSYLDNLTSSIQTQIDGKLFTSSANIMTGLLTIDGFTQSGRISFRDNDGTPHYLTLASTSALTADYTLTFPTTAGTNGQILQTNGSGVLSWVTRPATEAAVPSTRLVATTSTSGLTGGGTLAADRTISLNVDNSTVEISGNILRVRDSGVTNAKVATGIDENKLIHTVTTINSNYTVTTSDHNKVFLVSGATTIALPTAVTAGYGFMVTFEKTDSANTVIIDASGAELINGQLTARLTTQYGKIQIMSISSGNWAIIAGNGVTLP